MNDRPQIIPLASTSSAFRSLLSGGCCTSAWHGGRRSAGRLWLMGPVAAVFGMCLVTAAAGQTVPREVLLFYTAEWEGERYPDGRRSHDTPSTARRQ